VWRQGSKGWEQPAAAQTGVCDSLHTTQLCAGCNPLLCVFCVCAGVGQGMLVSPVAHQRGAGRMRVCGRTRMPRKVECEGLDPEAKQGTGSTVKPFGTRGLTNNPRVTDERAARRGGGDKDCRDRRGCIPPACGCCWGTEGARDLCARAMVCVVCVTTTGAAASVAGGSGGVLASPDMQTRWVRWCVWCGAGQPHV
jgi:hypothetical protein